MTPHRSQTRGRDLPCDPPVFAGNPSPCWSQHIVASAQSWSCAGARIAPCTPTLGNIAPAHTEPRRGLRCRICTDWTGLRSRPSSLVVIAAVLCAGSLPTVCVKREAQVFQLVRVSPLAKKDKPAPGLRFRLARPYLSSEAGCIPSALPPHQSGQGLGCLLELYRRQGRLVKHRYAMVPRCRTAPMRVSPDDLAGCRCGLGHGLRKRLTALLRRASIEAALSAIGAASGRRLVSSGSCYVAGTCRTYAHVLELYAC